MSLHCGPADSIPSALMRQVYVVPSAEKAETLSAMKVLGFTRERLFSDISMAVDAFLDDVAGRSALVVLCSGSLWITPDAVTANRSLPCLLPVAHIFEMVHAREHPPPVQLTNSRSSCRSSSSSGSISCT